MLFKLQLDDERGDRLEPMPLLGLREIDRLEKDLGRSSKVR
jgi:hypothetical protein